MQAPYILPRLGRESSLLSGLFDRGATLQSALGLASRLLSAALVAAALLVWYSPGQSLAVLLMLVALIVHDTRRRPISSLDADVG